MNQCFYWTYNLTESGISQVIFFKPPCLITTVIPWYLIETVAKTQRTLFIIMQWNALRSETVQVGSGGFQYSAPGVESWHHFSRPAVHAAEASSISASCQVMPSAQPCTREPSGTHSRWPAGRSLPSIPANQMAAAWKTADCGGCQPAKVCRTCTGTAQISASTCSLEHVHVQNSQMGSEWGSKQCKKRGLFV